MNDLVPVVTVIDNQPRTLSTDVAKFFEKEHFHVLRDIRKILDSGDHHFNQSNFGLVEIKDVKGENRPAYSMTRDGFALLAMGFTGENALKWKIKYIEAFNAMEAELKKDRNHGEMPGREDPLGGILGQAIRLAQDGRAAATIHLNGSKGRILRPLDESFCCGPSKRRGGRDRSSHCRPPLDDGCGR